MSRSEVDICNRALRAIGEAPIVSLTQEGDVPALCRSLYPDLRDAILREAKWTFSIRRSLVGGAEANTPAFGYDFSYILPVDAIKVLQVYNEQELLLIDDQDWQVEGNRLLSDYQNLRIRYVARIEDTTQFDELFTEALIYRLAAELVEDIENNASLRADMYTFYRERLQIAKSINSTERAPRTLDFRSNWLDSRQGGNGIIGSGRRR